jgi:succinate-semialdehyde dehydrogenase/glutarate-semialdehyde dehydrogenase
MTSTIPLSVSAQATQASMARMIQSFNPGTGEKVGEVPMTPLDALPDIMARARVVQRGWHKRGLQERLAIFRRFKEVFYVHREEIVSLIAAEQGKLPFEGQIEEFWPCIELVSYYLRNAESILRPRTVYAWLVPHRYQRIEYRPYGVVMVITPWNFPLYLSLPQIVTALLAGNSVIFKPSEFCPLSGQLIAEMLWEAGVPRDVFQVVQGEGDVAAATIRLRPDKIVFTGSVPTGRKVALAAAEQLIPVTLELGGKDAAIVLDDADLDRAAKGITFAGMTNSGQACASVERVFVMRSVAEPFLERLVQEVRDNLCQIGPEGTVRLTPITTPGQLQLIDAQVKEALAHGATAVIGGRVLDHGDGGRFYEPTILTNVTPAMRILTEETFGPVIPVMVVENDEEAIKLANDTGFGLLGSVWTQDRERGLRIARELKTGHSAINDHLLSANIPYLPWGGVGLTGYGRTRGPEGLLEMTTTQGFSYDLVQFPLYAQLLQYPHTDAKHNLVSRALTLLYGPTVGERLKAFRPGTPR